MVCDPFVLYGSFSISGWLTLSSTVGTPTHTMCHLLKGFLTGEACIYCFTRGDAPRAEGIQPIHWSSPVKRTLAYVLELCHGRQYKKATPLLSSLSVPTFFPISIYSSEPWQRCYNGRFGGSQRRGDINAGQRRRASHTCQ
jgi:hypothetical protein